MKKRLNLSYKKLSTRPFYALTVESGFLKRDVARVIQVLLDFKVLIIFIDEFSIGGSFLSPYGWTTRGGEDFIYANEV